MHLVLPSCLTSPKALLALSLVLITVLSSCSSDKAVTTGMIQKRKYRPGIHLDLNLRRNQAPKVLEQSRETEIAEVSAPLEETVEKEPLAPETVEVVSEDEQALWQEQSLEPKLRSNQGLDKKMDWIKTWPERTAPKILERFDDDEEEGYDPILPGVIGAVLAGVNLVTMFIPFLGLIMGILAIFFGVKALQTDDKGARVLGLLALVLAGLTLFIALLISLLFLFTFVFAF